ncbi:extracellular solute-binding protein [Sinorhizobium fredii]|uniref:extracellular solute-binding protein n=1 Tax=Rhizobium fredii TaxID=380 RepID=UPI000562EDCF|nr:extracellular solute-binding protein [Sinorhizobium fredii]ASY73841.1 ABC transporter, periplasmic spermidine putrescine-binding protein PotD [Sinorhizobium fredii CCBAU 83666]
MMDILEKRVGRRGFLAGSVAIATSSLPIPFVGSAVAQEMSGKQIRVLTWSDATGQAAVKNIMRTFEQKTGAKVVTDLTGATSDMIAKIKASAAKPQYDLVILSGFGASSLASVNLLEKPDLSAVPNLARVVPEYQTGADGHGIGYFLWSDGLIYNTKTYSKPPKSYEILWDPANDGKIFLPSPDNLHALELIMVAAKAAGGDAQNPDAGFELLKKLKRKSLAITVNANQIADLFRSESLNAGGVYSPLEISPFITKPEFNVGGTYDLAEGFFVDLQYMVVPKGHPGDTAVINAFINHALDAKVQGMMAEAVWYGPINQDAVLSDTAKSSPFIPSPQVIREKALRIDSDFLAKIRDNWIERYTEAVM